MALRIAVLQAAAVPADPAANLAALDDAAARAAADGAELVVTPECFLTGYDIGPGIADLARQDLVGGVARIARSRGLAVLAGTPTVEAGQVFNTAVLVDRAGDVVGVHRKSHLFGVHDRRFAAGPDACTVVELLGVRIAMMICYDVEFPETVRLAALAGAELIAVPTAQMEPFTFVAEHLLRVRAWENQVYVAYANLVGTERDTTYVGRSSISGPDGDVLAARRDGEALLLATVDPGRVHRGRRANPYLTDRRPDLYGGLAAPSPGDA